MSILHLVLLGVAILLLNGTLHTILKRFFKKKIANITFAIVYIIFSLVVLAFNITVPDYSWIVLLALGICFIINLVLSAYIAFRIKNSFLDNLVSFSSQFCMYTIPALLLLTLLDFVR
jgi:hypothetical protein